jgi:hypothetical protein
MAIKKPQENATAAAETLAIQALAFLGEDPERLGRFLAVTGIGPADLRSAAAEPQFLAGVLEYVVSDEPLLLEFANHAGIGPEDITRACAALGRGAWERDLP